MKRKMTLKSLSLLLVCVLFAGIIAISGCGKKDNVLGKGNSTFTFEVVDKDGNQTNFTIKTDAATVGDALVAENLIEGEESAYGLYVKKVNGITADYDVDGTYWAFYINGEYAMTGVDSTNVEDGATYMFKVE